MLSQLLIAPPDNLLDVEYSEHLGDWNDLLVAQLHPHHVNLINSLIRGFDSYPVQFFLGLKQGSAGAKVAVAQLVASNELINPVELGILI